MVSHVKIIESYANRIAGAWHRARESIIEVGDLLVEASEKLPPHEFRSLKNDLQDQKLMSNATISKLMAIARDQRLTRPETMKLLPNSYGTLYELTLLSDAQLNNAVKSGVLSPQTERKQILELKQGTPNKTVEINVTNLVRISADLDQVSNSTLKSIQTAANQLKKLKGVTVIETPNMQKII